MCNEGTFLHRVDPIKYLGLRLLNLLLNLTLTIHFIRFSLEPVYCTDLKKVLHVKFANLLCNSYYHF